jgi:hypothetical protein
MARLRETRSGKYSRSLYAPGSAMPMLINDEKVWTRGALRLGCGGGLEET